MLHIYIYIYIYIYRVKNVHFLNVRVKKYSRSQDSYVLQCILLKTFVRLMFAVLVIRELFLTMNICQFTVYIRMYIYIYCYIYIIYIHMCIYINFIYTYIKTHGKSRGQVK